MRVVLVFEFWEGTVRITHNKHSFICMQKYACFVHAKTLCLCLCALMQIIIVVWASSLITLKLSRTRSPHIITDFTRRQLRVLGPDRKITVSAARA